jgi:hypothetical protein
MEAAVDLVELCELLDEGKEIDEHILHEFQVSLGNVTLAVDRRKHFLAEVNSKIELAKNKRDEAKKAIEKFTRIKDKIIETTKFVIEQNPNIPFRDSLGKKLKVIKNPVPSLKVTGTWEGSEYAKIVNKVELDKEKLKDDLISGSEVEFAKLEYGTQLRGLK